MKITPVYTAHAVATGGRNGTARIDENPLDITLAKPAAMGGTGKGNNPEQLFAAGYAACFIGAMEHAPVVDKSLPKPPADTSIASSVGIGAREDGGFGLSVTLTVTLPGIDPEAGQRLIDTAHMICPYSNATRGNIEVTLKLA